MCLQINILVLWKRLAPVTKMEKICGASGD
jgi:hypothetical protein